MKDSKEQQRISSGAMILGILIGFIVGAIYTLLQLENRGETNRKNLTQFGAGSVDLSIDSSLEEAKQQAQERRIQRD